MHSNTTTATLACLLLLGCTREANTHDEVSPATAPRPLTDEPVPRVDIKNGAPLNNAENFRSRGAITHPGTEGSKQQADSEWTAQAELLAMPGRKLEGEVGLAEVAGTVQLRLEVEGAVPGSKRVVVSSTECPALRANPVGERIAPVSSVGVVAIGDNGEGSATLSLPEANLKPDIPGTLVGKSLVLLAAERVAGVPEGQEAPIACGQISRS